MVVILALGAIWRSRAADRRCVPTPSAVAFASRGGLCRGLPGRSALSRLGPEPVQERRRLGLLPGAGSDREEVATEGESDDGEPLPFDDSTGAVLGIGTGDPAPRRLLA